jgi:hypothetical protein
MSMTPETDAMRKNLVGSPVGRQIIRMTEHAERMEQQRNDVFNDLREAKRLLEWHTRKTQAAVDAFIVVKKELDELKAQSHYDDVMAMQPLK